MPKFYLLRGVDLYSDLADYPEQPEDRPEGVWVEGEPTGLTAYRPFNPEAVISQVSALLQYAQAQSAGDPFPLERQEEIFDLVGRIENYLRKGALSLALARANAFDVAGWEDLNEGQQTLATALKNQILALLPTP